jgi:hypothetical protein
MKPLPAQISPIGSAGAMPALPAALAPATASYSTSNRRASTCSVQRAYPWLLCASTALAAVFCLMYITKPVILAASNGNPVNPTLSSVEKPAIEKKIAAVPVHDLMPNGNRLPGEKTAPSTTRSRQPAPITEANTAFEETNLRIQHILTAEAPGGNVARIDIEVPVLYQSRNLRWTPSEVADARTLLARLSDYQEKSRILRAEGIQLLDSWNHLIERSIPTSELRADSPTLPVNQQDAADSPRPAGLNTTESIQIQPAGK